MMTDILTPLAEFRACMDPITGPQHFIDNYVYARGPSGVSKVKLRDYQIDWLNHIHNNTLSINVVARQHGKTSLGVWYALWCALFKPDTSTLMVVTHNNFRSELMGRIVDAISLLPDWMRAWAPRAGPRGIIFDSGSKIAFSTVSEHAGRGGSWDMMWMDEFAYANDRVARGDFSDTLTGVIESGAKCVIASSVNTATDLFAEMYALAGTENKFNSHKISWDMNPELDQAWADRTRAMTGDAEFDRSYACLFPKPRG